MTDDGWKGQDAPRVTSFDWWFRDRRTGRIVVAQAPNPALWIFLASVGVRVAAADDSALDATAGWVGSAALVWWALDELIRGVNPWRRVLGLGGLGLAAARVVALLG